MLKWRDAASQGQAGWALAPCEPLLPGQRRGVILALLLCHPDCSEWASVPAGAGAVTISSLLWLLSW